MPIDPKWHDRILAYAQREGSEFTALHPTATGLPVTVYASENPAYSAIIIDGDPGNNFFPSATARVFRIGDATGNLKIDKWIANNLTVLHAYCAVEIDTYVLNQQTRPIKAPEDSRRFAALEPRGISCSCTGWDCRAC